MTIRVRSITIAILPFAVALDACAHAGTQPHEMGAAQHEAAAAGEEKQAAEHGALYDQGAQRTRQNCSAGLGEVCWTETINPTEVHKKAAQEHREIAAQHRAASKALAEAEARSCAGISNEDRDASPFAHRADIQSVSRLQEDTTAGKISVKREAGATIVFRATPGLTAEWLQRIVDCHLARNSAVGHDMPEMTYCPLVPRGAQATVTSVGDGFAVNVRADDSAAAAEIWRRAQQLTPSH